MIYPSRSEAQAGISAGKNQLVWTKRVADLDTPVSAFLKLKQKNKPSFLLESVEGGKSRGRYSIIGLEPDLVWRAYGQRAEINATDPLNPDAFEPCWEDSLSSLRTLLQNIRTDIPEGLPPMPAGLIGYMGYDMIRQIERLPDTNPDPLSIPDACFMRPRLLCVFDSVEGVIFVISPIYAKDGLDPAMAYDAALARIEEAEARLEGPLDQRHYYQEADPLSLTFTANMSKERYFEMVAKAREHIYAGDIFQIVLAQRFSSTFHHPPVALYRALRNLNPSPFLFQLDFGSYALVGSSPEILVRLRGNTVTIRPIAGTRPRGANRLEDQALATELLADKKETAEHLMLLDLGRNDVGRVAKAGSVQVTEQMTIEYYSHVMHIVSNVEGLLAENKDALDALMAGFPAGTVSGAPKIRAMEIIDALEPDRRSFYAGGVGYFSVSGDMDSCITLRTGLIKDGILHIQAGGGIVADSTPEGEYQESCNKARAVMRAAELAAQFS